jgi:hypothetical protein
LTATESAIPSIRILMVLLDLLHSIIGPRADPTLYRRRESPPQKSHLYHIQGTLTHCHRISHASTTAPPLRAPVPEIASPWFPSISRVLPSNFELIRHCTAAERSVPWADDLEMLQAHQSTQPSCQNSKILSPSNSRDSHVLPSALASSHHCTTTERVIRETPRLRGSQASLVCHHLTSSRSRFTLPVRE